MAELAAQDEDFLQANVKNAWEKLVHQEDNGYRFIWRRPDGTLQGARGQARIPSIANILELTAKALKAGWGQHLSIISLEKEI